MSLKAELETWDAALKAYDEEDLDKALDLFARIADSSKILTNMGLIYATLGKHEAAIEHFIEATKLDSYLAVAYFQCGVSNFLLARYELAYKDFAEAFLYLRGNQAINYEQLGLKFRLFSAEVLFNQGLSLIRLGRIEEGLADMEEAKRNKANDEHNIIDNAIQDRGEGHTISMLYPVGVLYRPSEKRRAGVRCSSLMWKPTCARMAAKYRCGTSRTMSLRSRLPANSPRVVRRASFKSGARMSRPRFSSPRQALLGPSPSSQSACISALPAPSPAAPTLLATTPTRPSLPSLHALLLGWDSIDECPSRSQQLRRPTFAGPTIHFPSFRYFQRGVSNFLLTRYELAYKDFEEAFLYLRGNQAIILSPSVGIRCSLVWIPTGVRILTWLLLRSKSDNFFWQITFSRNDEDGTVRTTPGSSGVVDSRRVTMPRQLKSHSDDAVVESVELTKIRVKLHYDGDVRGMALTPDTPFEEFLDRVTFKFGKDIRDLALKFTDEDGGKVSLRDESDYELAIETAREFAKGSPEGKLQVWCTDV
ncbi:NADPH oxidase regulator NoxR [Mycena rebaudengoi]|nr:NADPH oxidase regulator NoxR [Mycena rebaudengoi]